MSSEDVDFSDPSSAGNFLARYKQARKALSPPSSPRMASRPSPIPAGQAQGQGQKSAPASPTQHASSPAKSVWSSVFHPLGKSPTSASRYDLSPGQTSKPGYSASEIHAKGTGIALDEIANE